MIDSFIDGFFELYDRIYSVIILLTEPGVFQSGDYNYIFWVLGQVAFVGAMVIILPLLYKGIRVLFRGLIP